MRREKLLHAIFGADVQLMGTRHTEMQLMGTSPRKSPQLEEAAAAAQFCGKTGLV
jgi:hypothetical protein